MNKKTKIVVGLSVGLLVVAITLAFYLGLFPQSALSSTFTPVYCNNYEFTCCVKNDAQVQRTIDENTPFVCPNTGIGCQVTLADVSGSLPKSILVGSQNCRHYSALLGAIHYYTCDDGKAYTVANGVATSISVAKGQSVYPMPYSSGTISVTLLDQKLIFAGRSGAEIGSTLKTGSCVYNLNSGDKLSTVAGGALPASTSYTVPLQECVLSWQASDRFICGNLEEQCSADADCGGHTYGSQECNARTLQTYGCVDKSPPSNLVPTVVNGQNAYLDPALDKNKGGNAPTATAYNGVLSRCEITSAKSVECCGDADCGSNAVCDKTTWTCKAPSQVQCRVAADCAVSTQCDYSTKQLKTPACAAGVCSYSSKAVGCCVDANCPVGQFCNAQNTCAAKTAVDVLCPFECCDRDVGYIDRGCSAGLFCADNKCGAQPECLKDADCAKNFMCTDSKCVPVASECKDKWGGLIPAAVGTKEDCSFLCKIGLKDPETVNVCVYDHTPLVVVSLLIVFVLGLALYAKSRSKKGRKGGKTAVPEWLTGENGLLRNKTFWIGVVVLIGLALVIGYFAYFFWAFIILFALALAYVIVRIFVFKLIW